MTDTITLENGKYYLDRGGKIHGPMSPKGGGFLSPTRIDEGDVFDWYEDGSFSYVHDNHPFDLIAEVFAEDIGEDEETGPAPFKKIVREELVLVPGDYGRFRVVSESHGEIYLTYLPMDGSDWFTATELREAAALFTKLAKFLDEK
jgi:hypothetical protein